MCRFRLWHLVSLRLLRAALAQQDVPKSLQTKCAITGTFYLALPLPSGSNPNFYSLFTKKLPLWELFCEWRIERDYSAFAPFTAALAYMPPAYFRLPAPCSQTLSPRVQILLSHIIYNKTLHKGGLYCKWRIERDYSASLHSLRRWHICHRYTSVCLRLVVEPSPLGFKSSSPTSFTTKPSTREGFIVNGG